MRQTGPSRLQGELVRRIAGLIQSGELAAGARVTEVGLAQRLSVSRTPVRAALAILTERGVIERQEDRGLAVAHTIDPAVWPVEPAAPTAELDRLTVSIAHDRIAARIPAEVSESDLMRRYRAPRRTLQRVLERLAEVALVERKPGHGWRFLPSIDDSQARSESYRFRLLIEPAALLEPGFAIDRAWLAEMRRRHEAMIAAPWRETSSVALFEMNAEFHEGLAAAAGNRYILAAIQQQNRLRRFNCYDWIYGRDRVVVSCEEHLEIIARLERDDVVIAAALLRRHLESAADLNRGLRTTGHLSVVA